MHSLRLNSAILLLWLYIDVTILYFDDSNQHCISLYMLLLLHWINPTDKYFVIKCCNLMIKSKVIVIQSGLSRLYETLKTSSQDQIKEYAYLFIYKVFFWPTDKKYRGITLSFQKARVKGSIWPLLAEWGIAQTIPCLFRVGR